MITRLSTLSSNDGMYNSLCKRFTVGESCARNHDAFCVCLSKRLDHVLGGWGACVFVCRNALTACRWLRGIVFGSLPVSSELLSPTKAGARKDERYARRVI